MSQARRQAKTGELVSISAADPLNLVGILTQALQRQPVPRAVRAYLGNRP
jgi:hypothetical protein